MRFAYEANGKLVWRDRTFADGPPPREIEVDGVTYKRCYQAEQKAVPPTTGWPIECLASGVNARDADKLRDHLEKAGVPTEVSADGNPIYTSAAHRRRALKARGLFDKDSYY